MGVGYPRAEDSDAVPWLGGRRELFPHALNHSVTLYEAKLFAFLLFLRSVFLSHNCCRCGGREKTSRQAPGLGLRLCVSLQEVLTNTFSQVNSSSRFQ